MLVRDITGRLHIINRKDCKNDVDYYKQLVKIKLEYVQYYKSVINIQHTYIKDPIVKPC
jgi:hypothetical protein